MYHAYRTKQKADSLICVPLSPPQDIVVLDRIFPLIVTFPRFSIFSLSLSRSLFLSLSLLTLVVIVVISLFISSSLCSLFFFFVRLYVLCFFLQQHDLD